MPLLFLHSACRKMSMESHLLLVFLLLCLTGSCHANVLFSSLPRTIGVSASPKEGQVLKAGKDSITVSWELNASFIAAVDESYKDVKVNLCYAPISQVDRPWRKTVDNLNKDKTCQFTIAQRTYGANKSVEWRIASDVPTAVYFLRVYIYNSALSEVAYGQTTNMNKNSNLFKIQGISGRHLSLDIASACFCGFALISLFGFYMLEKRSWRSANN